MVRGIDNHRRGGALLRPLCVTNRAGEDRVVLPYGEIDACRNRPAVHRPYRAAFGPSIARDPVPLTKKRAGHRPALTDKIGFPIRAYSSTCRSSASSTWRSSFLFIMS